MNHKWIEVTEYGKQMWAVQVMNKKAYLHYSMKNETWQVVQNGEVLVEVTGRPATDWKARKELIEKLDNDF